MLRGVSLKISEGAICMILGPSGSGKTTFLKAVKGLLRPQKGSISIFGLEVSARLNGRLRGGLGHRVAYIPQNLGLVRGMTVLENALTGALGRTGTFPSLVKAFSLEDVLEAKGLLDTLGIGPKTEEKVYNLSGGERQRVAIARALMQRPQLVLADEFVSQLDPVTSREMMGMVLDIVKGGVTFLITCHEMDLVSRYGDMAVFLRDGQKVYECLGREVDADSISRFMG